MKNGRLDVDGHHQFWLLKLAALVHALDLGQGAINDVMPMETMSEAGWMCFVKQCVAATQIGDLT